MTYCRGPYINISHDITKAEYIKICDEITRDLNAYYQEFHKDFSFVVEVVPEPITEGGLLIKYYLNNEYSTQYYKTMRIINNDKYYRRINNYPWVPGDCMKSWQNNDEIVYKANRDAHTFLKAFDKANRWTSDEIKIFLKVFTNHGIYFVKGFLNIKQLDSCINNYQPLRLKNEEKKYIKTCLRDFK